MRIGLLLGVEAILVSSAFAGTISVQPSPLDVMAGQTFALEISASGITDLYAFQFDLGFTPGILAASSVTEGPLLVSGGTTIFVPGVIDNVTGTISFTADSLVGSVPGVSADGVLAIVQMQAHGSGEGPITLANVVLLDSALSEIIAATRDGSVSVSGVPEPRSCALCVVPVGVLFWRLYRKSRC